MNIAMVPNKLLAKIKTEVFSKDDIKLYIKSLIDVLELHNYYNGVIFNNKKVENLASYNFETKNFRIFYKMMIKTGIFLNKKYNYPLVLITNLTIIHAILHEIVHAYQNACIHECDFPIYHIYTRELDLTETLDNKKYNSYYKYLIYEREAETIALENLLMIIRTFVPDAEIFYFYMELLKKTIISGYEFRDKVFYSPLNVIYQDLFKEDTPEIYVPDVYDALKIGTNVSIRQYRLFKKNYQRIILDKNNLHVK